MAASIARPVVGSPVVRNAVAAATLPAARLMLIRFLPGRLVGLLGRTP